MDALAHNLEAFCAPGFHPMADGIAIEGMKLIKKSLLVVVNNGKDLNARADLLAAASMGSTAFQKGLGAIHSLRSEERRVGKECRSRWSPYH